MGPLSIANFEDIGRIKDRSCFVVYLSTHEGDGGEVSWEEVVDVGWLGVLSRDTDGVGLNEEKTVNLITNFRGKNGEAVHDG